MKLIRFLTILVLLQSCVLLPGCKERTDPSPSGTIDARLVGTWELVHKANIENSLDLDHSRMILNARGYGYLMDTENVDQIDSFYWAVKDERINFTESNKWFSVEFDQSTPNHLTIIEDRYEPYLYYTYERLE